MGPKLLTGKFNLKFHREQLTVYTYVGFSKAKIIFHVVLIPILGMVKKYFTNPLINLCAYTKAITKNPKFSVNMENKESTSISYH